MRSSARIETRRLASVLMRPAGSLRTRPPVTTDMARRFSERLRAS
jgi:hypothetical protein